MQTQSESLHSDVHTPASFAWVRSVAVLEAALRDVGALTRLDGLYGSPRKLLGIWVGAGTGADDPSQLSLGSEWESTSLSGLWTLMSTRELALSRSALLDVLVPALGPHEHEHGRFLPVFASDTNARQLAVELSGLRMRHPRLISTPLLQSRRGALWWVDSRTADAKR